MDEQRKKFGNYEVERRLGSGAFADVYLGKHIYLNTSVAIKILHTRLDESDLQSFLEEARTVAGLTHPNIIRVLEFGVEEQIPYLVMDYAPAGTLRQRYPRPERLTVSACATYMNQIASALQYAHDHHVIHRDVKPENMLLGQHGQLLLSDFGIAVAAQNSRYQDQQEFGGTAAYASPEQINLKASYASDQYALGIILYEWLTGELPFRGSFFEVCSQHLFKLAPSLLEKLPNLPPTIEQLYQRAVAKEPQQRFSRVEDFAQALEMANQGDDPTALIKDGLSSSASSRVPPFAQSTLSPSPRREKEKKDEAPLRPLRPIAPSSPLASQQEKRNLAMTALIGILLVLLVGTGIWGYNNYVAGNKQAPTQGPGPQTTQPSRDSGNASNVGDSTPTPTPQPSVIVSDGTYQIDKSLGCGNCDDPVHVKMDTVTVQNGNGRMIWALTFINVSGAPITLSPTISLHDPTSAHDSFPESISDANGNSCDISLYLDTALSADCNSIFTFLPYTQTTYTFTVEIQDAYSNDFDVKFDPLDVTLP